MAVKDKAVVATLSPCIGHPSLGWNLPRIHLGWVYAVFHYIKTVFVCETRQQKVKSIVLIKHIDKHSVQNAWVAQSGFVVINPPDLSRGRNAALHIKPGFPRWPLKLPLSFQKQQFQLVEQYQRDGISLCLCKQHNEADISCCGKISEVLLNKLPPLHHPQHQFE